MTRLNAFFAQAATPPMNAAIHLAGNVNISKASASRLMALGWISSQRRESPIETARNVIHAFIQGFVRNLSFDNRRN